MGRRFTLRDATIIVACMALGFGLLRMRFAFAHLPQFFASIVVGPWRFGVVMLRLSGLFELATPFAQAGTLGLVALRLLPPRPDRLRLARRPGFVACVVASALGAVAYGAVFATLGLRGKLAGLGPLDWAQDHGIASLFMTQFAGWGVAASWLTLALGGRWRPEPSWFDRAGRALGWFWIAGAVVMTDVQVAFVLHL